jgi:hypothetical protein
MCENSEKENYQNKIQSAELTESVFILDTFCNNFYTMILQNCGQKCFFL